MATRYWVGGSGNWDATTTHWSATSGGASGASVPTSADDVIFNNLSNATLYTVTLLTAPLCASVTVGAPASGAVTIAGSAAWSIYGSMTLAATNVTWTTTSAITFAATTTGFTITTNGVSLANVITFNGAGGGWTLGSALTTTGVFTVTQGAFATANFNLTTGAFSSTGALTRSLTLGSSAISCTSWSALAATNLTVNAGTSTITLTAAAGNFLGGGLTYYNVVKGSNSFAIGDGGNTFNSLTNTTVTAGGTFACSFAGNNTIGTLTINGASSANGRASIQGTSPGTQVTLTVASFVTNGYVDFRDINFQGAASPLTVATGGNCGNNTNITLATPKTAYWSLAAGGSWHTSTCWALTSGGTPALANYPLPQDMAIIENAGLNSGANINFGSASMGTLNASTRTLPMTFSGTGQSPVIYGDFTLSSAITSLSGNFTFSGYNKTQTITSAGVTFNVNSAIAINNLSTTVTLADAFILEATKTFTLLLGTFNLNAKTASMGLFSSTGSGVRSIAFNGGTMTVAGATFTASGTNLTTSGSGTISMASASSKTFAGGGFSYPTLNQGGAGALVITGANTFANIANTVQPSTITLPSSTTTTVSNFTVNGTSGNLVTFNSSTSGTQATINYIGSSVINVNYLSIKDSKATPGLIWYANTTSTNVSNNTGWNFSAPFVGNGLFFGVPF